MSILLEAQQLITGDRQNSYGHALDNFQAEADILRALVKVRYGLDIPFTADFIGLFMAVGVKGAREAVKHSDENIKDGAGYFGCIEQIFHEIERRKVAADDNTGTVPPDGSNRRRSALFDPNPNNPKGILGTS